MSLRIYEGNFAVMGQRVGNLDSGTGRRYEGKVSKEFIVMLCQWAKEHEQGIKRANRGQLNFQATNLSL